MTRFAVATVLTFLASLSFTPRAAAQDLYATNGITSSVSRVGGAGGALTTLVPSGSGGLVDAQKVVFGPDGILYVSSFGRMPTATQPEVFGSIIRFDPTTGTFAGLVVPSLSGGLRHPNFLTIGPDNRLYVSDAFGSGRILRYNATTGASLGPLPFAGFPFDLAFGPDGLLYAVMGTSDASIVRYNPATGGFVDTWIPTGSGLSFPAGLRFGPDGQLYIGIGGPSGSINRVFRIDTATKAISTFTNPVSGIGPVALTDIAFGPDGHLYVSGFVDGQVLRYNGTTGAFMGVFATGSYGLTGLAFTPDVGATAANPILPQTQTGNTFIFLPMTVQPFMLWWFDPPAVVGYDYEITSGPGVRSVVLPPIGDGVFEIYTFNDSLGEYMFSGQMLAGAARDFGSAGVRRFRIVGIEESAGLAPTDPLAFPTGLTFVTQGVMSLTMTALEGPGPVRVPSVVGLGQIVAQTTLTLAGLAVGNITTASSLTVPAGNVISQSVPAGASVDRGRVVDLVVSSGPPTVIVPDVVGLTQTEAAAALAAASLQVGTVTGQASTTVPAGVVISQEPPAGTSVTVNSSVHLVVSSGPPTVLVPDVVGLAQATAEAAIVAAGLVVGTVTTAPSASVPAGHVAGQTPSGGTSVQPGSGVDLVVSSGAAGQFRFTGFLRPLVNLPATNVAQAGRTIPLRFGLGGDHGLDVLAPGSPFVVAVPCTGGTMGPAEQAEPAGRSGLTYDAASGTYLYAWKTDRAWANTCRLLVLRLRDGSEYSVRFRFMP